MRDPEGSLEQRQEGGRLHVGQLDLSGRGGHSPVEHGIEDGTSHGKHEPGVSEKSLLVPAHPSHQSWGDCQGPWGWLSVPTGDPRPAPPEEAGPQHPGGRCFQNDGAEDHRATGGGQERPIAPHGRRAHSPASPASPSDTPSPTHAWQGHLSRAEPGGRALRPRAWGECQEAVAAGRPGVQPRNPCCSGPSPMSSARRWEDKLRGAPSLPSHCEPSRWPGGRALGIPAGPRRG